MASGYPHTVESLVFQFLLKDGFVDAPAVAAAAQDANQGLALKELINNVVAQAVRINATVKF